MSPMKNYLILSEVVCIHGKISNYLIGVLPHVSFASDVLHFLIKAAALNMIPLQISLQGGVDSAI
jgi:hypothetical protein